MKSSKNEYSTLHNIFQFIAESVILTSLSIFCIADLKSAFNKNSPRTIYFDLFKSPLTWIPFTMIAGWHALNRARNSTMQYEEQIITNNPASQLYANTQASQDVKSQFSHVEDLKARELLHTDPNQAR